MRTHTDRRLVAVIALLAIASIVVDTHPAQQGAIAREIAAARAIGQTEVVLGLNRNPLDGDTMPNARSAFGGLAAVVIARPRMDVAQVVALDAIHSFTEAMLERVMFEPAANGLRSDLCTGVPAAPAMDAGRIAIPLKRGQIIVDGVTVRMGGPQSWLELADDRYLVLGAFCSTAVLSAQHFYPVSEDGTIWPLQLHGPGGVDLSNPGILRQGVIDRVPEFLTAVERDPAAVDRQRLTRASMAGPGGPGAISGRVILGGAGALPGATVTVVSRTSAGVASTFSQPDGRYRIDALPADTYRVLISLSGFVATVVEYMEISDATILDASLGLRGTFHGGGENVPTGRLAGRVTDEHGRPWPMASVTINQRFLGRLLTDADGRYALTQVLPGRYPIRIAAAGFDLVEGTMTIERDRTTRVSTVLTRSSPRRAGATFASGSRTAAFRVETAEGAWTMVTAAPSTPVVEAFIADAAAHRFDTSVAVTAGVNVFRIDQPHNRPPVWSLQLADDAAGGVSVQVRRGDAIFTARVSEGDDVVRRIMAFMKDGRIAELRPLPLLAVSRAR